MPKFDSTPLLISYSKHPTDLEIDSEFKIRIDYSSDRNSFLTSPPEFKSEIKLDDSEIELVFPSSEITIIDEVA